MFLFKLRGMLHASIGCGMVAIGCGGDFAPPSAVESLRVLGVAKSTPYAAPGEDVVLSMLWHDTLRAAETEASVTWFGKVCANPPGDLFSECLPTFRGEPLDLVRGDEFSFRVPSDILSARSAAPADQPIYGLVYVFFAVCRGHLEALPQIDGDALPVACRNSRGDVASADDFVGGYVSVYVYSDPSAPTQPLRNQNPALSGFQVNGITLPGCIGTDTDHGDATPCVTAAGAAPLEDVDCSDATNSDRCFDSCKGDGAGSCPGIRLSPLVDASIAERDPISAAYYARDVTEQMWIDYYTDRGSVDSSVRLLNDATRGWNPEFATEFRAPRDPGPVTLWAVVHDNRGGTNWVRTRIGIRPPG